MKHIALSLLMATVMLKVWWHNTRSFMDDSQHQGIYMNVADIDGDESRLFVRDATGRFYWVEVQDITKQKWVNVEADK